MTNYQPILDWAINGVDDPKMKRAIKQDILKAFGGRDTKRQSIFTELHASFNGFANLPAALRSIPVGDRVRTSELKPCRFCTTPHGDGYICNLPSDPKDASRDRHLGHNCAEYLTQFGLPAGVLTKADKATIRRNMIEQVKALDDLVMDDRGPVAIVSDREPMSDADEDFLGSQLGWLTKRYKTLPDNVKQALDNIKDEFHPRSPKDTKLVMDYIAQERKFPAETYKFIADDVSLMESEERAPRGIAQVIRTYITKETPLTGAKAKQLLDGVDYRGFRIERNTATMNGYERNTGVTLANVLNSLAPAVEHDKPLWHADLIKQRFLFNKVLSEGDYRLVAGCFNRWRFGHTSEVEGSDALALRNRAIRRESVENFERRVEGLVAISRKIDYAQKTLTDKDYRTAMDVYAKVQELPDKERFKGFKAEADRLAAKVQDPLRLLKEPCIPVEAFIDSTSNGFHQHYPKLGVMSALTAIKRTYTNNRSVRDFKKDLPTILQHAEAGILRKDDVRRIERAYERVVEYVRAR